MWTHHCCCCCCGGRSGQGCAGGGFILTALILIHMLMLLLMHVCSVLCCVLCCVLCWLPQGIVVPSHHCVGLSARWRLHVAGCRALPTGGWPPWLWTLGLSPFRRVGGALRRRMHGVQPL